MFPCTAFSVEAPKTKEQLYALAKVQVKQVENDLTEALAKVSTTNKQLNSTIAVLDTALANTKTLQDQVTEQTRLLNEANMNANKEHEAALVWQAKQEEAVRKLNWWRKLAAGIGGLITLYVGLKVLKIAGKLSVPFI